jgi:Pyridoxamine 5'-phosphate oxidase
MNLKKYFDANHGIGVLATADKDGTVDAAIYSRPHVFEDGTVAFLMRERLTYRNVQANPYATYLFVEGGTGYSGIRLYLKRIKEDNDPDLITRMTRSGLSPQEDTAKGPKHLVHFRIEKILQLIGSEQANI